MDRRRGDGWVAWDSGFSISGFESLGPGLRGNEARSEGFEGLIFHHRVGFPLATRSRQRPTRLTFLTPQLLKCSKLRNACEVVEWVS